jgi:hypothetical protein
LTIEVFKRLILAAIVSLRLNFYFTAKERRKEISLLIRLKKQEIKEGLPFFCLYTLFIFGVLTNLKVC